jgi:hypothetical protein
VQPGTPLALALLPVEVAGADFYQLIPAATLATEQ